MMLTIEPVTEIIEYRINNEYAQNVGKFVHRLSIDEFVFIPQEKHMYENGYFYRADTLKQITSMLENLNAKSRVV